MIGLVDISPGAGDRDRLGRGQGQDRLEWARREAVVRG